MHPILPLMHISTPDLLASKKPRPDPPQYIVEQNDVVRGGMMQPVPRAPPASPSANPTMRSNARSQIPPLGPSSHVQKGQHPPRTTTPRCISASLPEPTPARPPHHHQPHTLRHVVRKRHARILLLPMPNSRTSALIASSVATRSSEETCPDPTGDECIVPFL